MAHTPLPVLTLESHARFRCQHSGACCRSGWGIPLSAASYADALSAAERGTLALSAHAGGVAALRLPAGASGTVVIPTHHGACVFHSPEDARCALHRDMGEAALPPACRHFPRVCRLDRDAVRITLSHYCPTVAATLGLAGPTPAAIVGTPASCPPHWVYEGLDTTPAGAPLLHPSMYLDHDAYLRIERAMVRQLTCGRGAEWALAALHAQVERLRDWQPRHGSLDQAVEAALSHPGPTHAPDAPSLRPQECDWFDQVLASVPPIVRRPVSVAHAPQLFDRWVAPAWDELKHPVAHFMAAKAFGNWTAYLGQGLRTVLRSLDVSLAVLKVELTRACAGDQCEATRDHLVRAARSADLLLVHLAQPSTLAGLWSAAEDSPRLSERRGPRRPRRASER